MHNQIKEEIEKRKNSYLQNVELISSDFNRETSISLDYEGRQMFELLQNANDEAEEAMGRVLIMFDGKTLSVSNTGTAFSLEGVKALLYANNSSKNTETNKIGCKGLGFRSLLTWADKITIASIDFTIQFSKENAIRVLESILTEKPEYKEILKTKSKDPYPISILSCPIILDDNKLIKDYSTSIIIECKEELRISIEEQIKKLQFEELLFLPNIIEIEIECNNYHKTFYKCVYEKEAIIEISDLITGEKNEASWILFKRDGYIGEAADSKHYEFIIAYDQTGQFKSEVLYSYFKTEVELRYPALIHGTFELTSTRNGLINSDTNKLLFEKLADFLVETAITIAENQQICNYDPLKMIISTHMDHILTDTFKLDEKLKKKAQNAKILPTINGNYISLADKPKYSKYSFDKLLKAEDFPTLMPRTDDASIEKYINQELDADFYDYSCLCKTLNRNISNYTRDEKVKLIKLIEYQYPHTKLKEVFPHLLEDINGDIIESSERVFPAPSEEKVLKLPEWASIKFISPEMWKLLRKSNTHYSSRGLIFALERYHVDEYSFEKLLRLVVNQGNAITDNANEKCKDILEWLWENYKKNPQTFPSINDVHVKILCRNGIIENANKCYFGKEYSNILGEKIISIYSDNFISHSCINADIDDVSLFITFLEGLGISKYPRLVSKTLTGDEKNCYIKLCSPLYVERDNRSYQYYEFNTETSVKVGYFEHFDQILEKLEFNDLIAWFLKDNRVLERLVNSTEELNTSSLISGLPSRKRDIRYVWKDKMKSYIRWILQKKEWIPNKDGIKKSPDYCCFEDNQIAPVVIVPSIDYEYISEKYFDYNCKKAIVDLLSRLGVHDTFQELSNNVIYDVLFRLPQIDTDCKIGKSIYRKALKSSQLSYINSGNQEYDNFIKQGKVLAITGSNRSYVPIPQVFYSDKMIFLSDRVKNISFLDVDRRSGEDKIRRIFGVKSIKNFHVQVYNAPTLHPLDSAFKKEYTAYLPFVFVPRMDLKNSRMNFLILSSTKVTLCTELQVKYTFNEITNNVFLHDYESQYFRDSKTAYIVIPASIKSVRELQNSWEFKNALADLITELLDFNDDRSLYRELFGMDLQSRENLIRTDFNDDNFELLNKARSMFNSEVNMKDEFWMTIANILQVKLSLDTTIADIITTLKVDQEIVSSLNYDNLSDISNTKHLVKLFNYLRIDVPDFNIRSIRTIDLTEYWQKKFRETILKYKKKYQAYLFSLLVNIEDNAEQFEEMCESYENTKVEIQNSVSVDMNGLFTSNLKVDFETLNKINENFIDDKIDRVLTDIKDSDKKALENHYSNLTIFSYALFDRLNDLLAPLNSTVPNTISNPKETECKELVEIVLSSETAGFRSIEPIKPEIVKENESHNGTSTASPKHHKRTYNQTLDIHKQSTGLIGEAVVYKELKELYPSTRWVSGNAEKANCIMNGDDTLGYDLIYNDENNTTHYVEVKSSRGNQIVFTMSHNELKFACENADFYEVIFVHIDETGKPLGTPIRLGHLFKFADGEDIFHNKLFTIESNSYTITTVVNEDR